MWVLEVIILALHTLVLVLLCCFEVAFTNARHRNYYIKLLCIFSILGLHLSKLSQITLLKALFPL